MLRNKIQGQGNRQEDQPDPVPIFERLLPTASTNELQQPSRRTPELAVGHGKEERNRQSNQRDEDRRDPGRFHDIGIKGFDSRKIEVELQKADAPAPPAKA